MIKFSDLTPGQVQEICKAFAKREGLLREDGTITYDADLLYDIKSDVEFGFYTTDLNAMHRIIEGMDEMEIQEYWYMLCDVTGCDAYDWAITDALKATCQQQFVAAAMALGLINERERQ